MAKCLQILKACQNWEAKLDYGFDWTHTLARRWTADHPYDTGVVVRPVNLPSGWEYISDGGQSGSEEPNWPKVAGATIKDGSITWTTQAMSDDSLQDGIASDVWSVSVPAGLMVSPSAPIVSAGLQQTMAVLSEGTIGVTYVVENEITTDQGYEYVARIILTIEG